MTLSTRLGRRWVALLAVAGLLAGCQSSRPAFLFAPAAPYSAARPPAEPTSTAAPVPGTAPLAPAASSGLPAGPPAVARVMRRLVAHPARHLVGQPACYSGAAVPAATAAAVVAPRRVHRYPAAPAHTAENGLGRIFFFLLAVLLGVLAGLGALVSLIPGVSFWGGVGLVAAGLVVLFLLYKLLSGGKKKN